MATRRSSHRTVQVEGVSYVLVPEAEYLRLAGLVRESPLPFLPEPDARGNFPAVDYARVSIARELVAARARAGLSQKELAGLAGVRVETLCRLERGKHTADTRTLVKLDRALKAVSKRSKGRRQGA